MKIIRKPAETLPFDPATVEVAFREPLLRDVMTARKVAGVRSAEDMAEMGSKVTAALIAICCAFDDRHYTMEEVLGWPAAFVDDLGNALTMSGATVT